MDIIGDIDNILGLYGAKELDQIKGLLTQKSEAEIKNLLVLAINREPRTFSLVLEAILTCTSSSKRLAYMIEALKELTKNTMEGTLLKDCMSIIYLHLNSIPPSALTSIAKYFLSEIREGNDSRLWTELLPRTLQILVKEYGSHEITTCDYDTMLGYAYRTSFLDSLIKTSPDWKPEILPAIASMLRNGVPLTDHERFLFMERLCFAVKSLRPTDLTTYAYHLFRASNVPKLLAGVLFALNSYLNKHYYTRQIRAPDVSDPSLDSIDECPLEVFYEMEQNILVHIYNTTEYDLAERQVATALKEVTYTPSVILSPFMLEALLSITTMNRSCDANKVSKSDLLNTIRMAIFNNIYEENMTNASLYIKNHLTHFPKPVDVDEILKVLVKNSKKGSNEIVTAGVIGLSYSLLRYRKHGEQLYYLAAKSLIQFLNQRRLYIKGVIETLLQQMLSDPKAVQYKECLEMIVNSRLSITAHECKDLLKNVFEDMPYMGASSALDMMSFIFPLMKNPGVSTTEVRTKFLNMIRKVVSDRNLAMRQMAAHGATMLLKHIKYDKVTSGAPNQLNLTAPFITGYSLISQMTQMRRQAPTPHDMLTLEIMGVLTKCLGQDYNVKKVMYRGLRRAAGFNHKVLPHVIDFLIPHFKNFIELTGSHFQLKMEHLVSQESDTVVIHDNIGVLAELLIYCVVEADVHQIQTENQSLSNLLTTSLDKSIDISMVSFGVEDPLKERGYILGVQFLGFLEALMTYALWKAKPNNENIFKMLKIFEHYTKCCRDLKKLCTFKPGSKRKKEDWMKKIKKIDSVFDVGTLIHLLQIFYDPEYKKLSQELIISINSNAAFKQKILSITAQQINALRYQPEYVQVKHSKRSLDQLSTCAFIAYNQIKLLVASDDNDDFYSEETIAIVEILKECTVAATTTFNRKFEVFSQKILATEETDTSKNSFFIITEITEVIKKLCADLEETTFVDGAKSTKLFSTCLLIVDKLLPYIEAGAEYADLLYKYFFDLCSSYILHSRSLGLIFKILYILREKSTLGEDFYTTVAVMIAKQYGFIKEQENEIKFNFKAITEHTVEQATISLLAVVRDQLDHYTFLLKKANCLLYRFVKIPGQKQEKDEITRQITEIERMTIHSLISICKVMLSLTNAQIPLGRITDSILRDLILLNANGEKLSKIFINHMNAVNDVVDFFRYREFIKVSKPLTRQMGAFILHVEDLSTEAASNSRLSGTQAAKKVLKDSRLIPKYVFYNEKFSCAVISLSSKAKEDFKDYLHLGVYRDFKIRTEELKNAVLQSAKSDNVQSDSNEFQLFDEDESDMEEDEPANSSDKEDSNESEDSEPKRQSKRIRIK